MCKEALESIANRLKPVNCVLVNSIVNKGRSRVVTLSEAKSLLATLEIPRSARNDAGEDSAIRSKCIDHNTKPVN
jgi:hypothetical protein